MPKRRTLDMSKANAPKFRGSGREKSMSKKQIRARARRHGKISEYELNKLYKPLEEWDAEELARGRPRNAGGTFAGKAPSFITRELHEEAIQRFNKLLKDDMRASTGDALQYITNMLMDDSVDDRGRPLVPASVRLNAAQFLIEHAIGKPVQHMESEISVKLQAVLAAATSNPSDDFELGILENPEIVDAEWSEEDDD